MNASEEELTALNLAVSAAMPSLSGVKFDVQHFNYSITLDSPFRGEFVGGDGITYRSIDEIERMIPTVSKRFLRETGKIIFLGNGLSNVPLITAERHLRGKLKEIPVIVDLFDYESLQKDYENIMENCRRNNCVLPLHLQPDYEIARAINQACQEGHLKTVVYYVGSGKIPVDLKGASLAINCMGPNFNSINEQISMLAIGGELYTHYYLDKLTSNALLTPIIKPPVRFIDGEPEPTAFIYTRTN